MLAAALAEDKPADAIVEFRRVDPIFRAGIQRRLGEPYEPKGDTAKAVEQYRAFIDLWKNADPELQPRVTEIRRQLAQLTPVERPGKR
jgi:hypothetical protein